MEKKTIGSFLSALRKANGLTQRQLAEKLNVSDKAVSRWERDETMPDLTLIPVLAEIFGVTSDEILRGERKDSTGSHEKNAVKIAQQRKLMLSARNTKYSIRSTITVGIAVMGLIAAMICNFGFLRAYLGFMIGSILFVTAVVCQTIFLTLHLAGLDEDILPAADLAQYRSNAIHQSATVFGFVITLVGACVPLVVYPWDTFQGLEGQYWGLYGVLYAAITAIVLSIVWAVIRVILVRRELLQEPPQTIALLKLRLAFTGILALTITILIVVQCLLNSFLPSILIQGTQLHSWNEFKILMETPLEPYDNNNDIIYWEPSDVIGMQISNNVETEVDVPIESVPIESENAQLHGDGTLTVYSDAPLSQIYDHDGKLLCEFIHRNHTISSWNYTYNSDGLTITVCTIQDWQQVNEIMDTWVNPIYVILYPLAALVCLLLYYKYKKRL